VGCAGRMRSKYTASSWTVNVQEALIHDNRKFAQRDFYRWGEQIAGMIFQTRSRIRKQELRMKYTTVIFDLDGTLLNTLEDLMDAVNYALEQFGYPQRTLEEIRTFVGNGVRKLMERSLPDGAQNVYFEEALAAFRAYYTEHCEDKTQAYDGVIELMERLKAEGCRLAIVSNKLDRAVKALNQSYFKGMVQAALGDQEGIRRKPAPDMVENALAELNSSKSEAVYVGDSDVDIQTAANSGLPCISVSWGFRDAQFLRECGAAVIADTPQQVYDYICRGIL